MGYKDAEQQREYQRQWMAERRAKALEGMSCAYCAATEDLHFHHFDPAIKVSHNVWSWTEERRREELAKCIVLCRSCHVDHHRQNRPQFCKRGHELTEANSYWKPGRTTRECRTCKRERTKRSAERKAA